MQETEMAHYVNDQFVTEPRRGQEKKENAHKTERRLGKLLFLSFGLLCVLQAMLNVSLRLIFYSNDESVILECNATQLTDLIQLQTDLKKCKTKFIKLTDQHNNLEERFNALTRDNNLLENRITELNNMKKNVEEERHRLRMRLRNLDKNYRKVSQESPVEWRKINSICYFLSTEMKTWVDSRDDCQTKGAHLVVINSEQEQRDLYRLNGNEWLLFWIGLSDRDTPGTYEWVDGSAPATLYWQSGQPDDGGPNKKEECVEMYHHNPVLNSWNDAPCEHKLHFLCEKKCINDM